MTEATDTAPPISPERLSNEPITALQSRFLLSSSNLSKNINFLNPENSNVPEFSEADLETDLDKMDFSVINEASNNERRRENGVESSKLREKVDDWAKIWETHFTSIKGTNKEKQLLSFLKQKNLTDKQLVNYYDHYFKADKYETDFNIFVKDVVGRYTVDGRIDLNAFRNDLEGITLFARALYGDTSGKIMAKLNDGLIKYINDPKKFIQEGNENRNNLTQEDKDDLTFLWANQPTVEPKPEPDVPAQDEDEEPPEPTEQTEQPAGEKTLEERFRIVVGKPNPENKSLKANYFFTSEPKAVQIDPNTYKEYEMIEPFFIPEQDGEEKFFSPNPKVIPYYYELSDETLPELRGPNYQADLRFMNAEASTNHDSSLFALVAGSAKTPEEQTILYRILSSHILQIHDKIPNLKTRWLAQQGDGRKPEEDSITAFYSYDHDPETKKLKEKPEERMLAYKEDGKLNSLLAFQQIWRVRQDELLKAFESNKILPHHIRWMEFLSHSVNVDKLIKDIRSRQPTPPSSENTEPTEKSRLENEAEYAKKFWDRNKNTNGLREAMSEEITREAKKGEFIKFVSATGITENDKEKLAAYQSLARELGYQIGEFTLDPKSGTATAKITPLKDDVPAETEVR